MPRRVKVDADIVLRLISGQHRPGRDRVLARGRQVTDGDIQVYLHLLAARSGRPFRPDIRRLGLE